MAYSSRFNLVVPLGEIEAMKVIAAGFYVEPDDSRTLDEVSLAYPVGTIVSAVDGVLVGNQPAVARVIREMAVTPETAARMEAARPLLPAGVVLETGSVEAMAGSGAALLARLGLVVEPQQ